MNKDDQKEVFIKALTTRAPNKRQIKPIDKDEFQLFEDLDSESDEDYVADSDDEESEEKDCGASSDDNEKEDKVEESPKKLSQDDQKEAYLKAFTTRDPSKRQIKPIDKDQLQLFENMPSESDEEYVANSDDDSNDSNINSSDNEDDSGGSESDDEGETSDNANIKKENAKKCVTKTEPIELNSKLTKAKLNNVLICMMCLMDDTYSDNEIVECDNCGIMVHEDCYKINDSIFLSCDSSDASTDPWFCDSCLLGNDKPMCELCPVNGGIFKKTEDNRWVHLICALYTPGVAFNDTDNLTEITLTEIPFKEWGGHECGLCEDQFYARMGVCISCDAGLCKNYFHVSCAQKEGLLSEPNIDENPDDPYFAQCRQHTDKDVARRRRKHLNAAINRHKMRMDEWEEAGHQNDPRIIRKLQYFNKHYHNYKQVLPEPFVPATKVRNYLEFNPIAVSLFRRKAINLDLPSDLMNSLTYSIETKTNANSGVPAFTPDFINYYLEREKKIDETSQEISNLENLHRDLQITEQNTSHKFNKMTTRKESMTKSFNDKFDHVSQAVNLLKKLSSDKETISRMQAILDKLENNFSGNTVQKEEVVKDEKSNEAAGTNNNAVDNVINVCKVCNSVSDQHLLLDCDSCKKYFHIGCLDPPLTRMPKKTKQYGWECSGCSPSSEEDNLEQNSELVDINKPRQLRKSVPDSASLTRGIKRKLALMSPLGESKQKSQNMKNSSLKRAKTDVVHSNTKLTVQQVSKNLLNEAKKRQLTSNTSCTSSVSEGLKKLKNRPRVESSSEDSGKSSNSKSESKSKEVIELSSKSQSKSNSSPDKTNNQTTVNRNNASDNIFSRFEIEKEDGENVVGKKSETNITKSQSFDKDDSVPVSNSPSFSSISPAPTPSKMIKKIRIILGSPIPKLYNLSNNTNSDPDDEKQPNKKKIKQKVDSNNNTKTKTSTNNNTKSGIKNQNQISNSTNTNSISNNSTGNNSNNENENDNENEIEWANGIRKSNRFRKRRVTLLDEIEDAEAKKPKKSKIKRPSSLKITRKLDFKNSSFKSTLSNGSDEPNIKLKIVKQPIPSNTSPILKPQTDVVESAYQQVIGVIAKRVPPTDPLKLATVSTPTSNKSAYKPPSGTSSLDNCHKKKTIKIKLHNDDDDEYGSNNNNASFHSEKIDELKQLKETVY